MAQDYSVKHATLTLDGTAQRLIAAFPDPTVAGVDDISCIALIIQPDGGNANPIFVGGAGVTTADYGFRLEAAAAGVPPAPFKIELANARTKPGRWYVIGTGTQKVHITLVAF